MQKITGYEKQLGIIGYASRITLLMAYTFKYEKIKKLLEKDTLDLLEKAIENLRKEVQLKMKRAE